MITASLPWYFSMYMHTCVPLWMLGCIFTFTVMALVMRWRFRYPILLASYLCFVLCQTVIFRGSSPEAHAILMPFWNYRDVFGIGNLEDFGEIVMNVVLFVPVGVLGAFKYKWYHVLAIGGIASLFIEVMQLVLHKGLCETDDVIHNTLGTLIGIGIVKLISVIPSLLSKTKKTSNNYE